jgi:plastocyanin
MKHALPLLGLGLLAALVLTACGGGGSEGSAGSGGGGSVVRTIRVKETEFALAPARVSISKPGRYTLVAVNSGAVDHALEVEGNGVEEETETVAPGESARLTVDLKNGSYEIYCPVGDHRERGMKGSVVVGGGGSGGGETTTNEDKGSGGYGY